MSNSTKDVLDTAKQIVVGGWHQGGNTDGQGNVCMRAAIGLAAGYYIIRGSKVTFPVPLPGESHNWRAELAALRLDVAACAKVTDSLPSPFQSIPIFNDHPQTSLSEVVAVLDKAISAC